MGAIKRYQQVFIAPMGRSYGIFQRAANIRFKRA